MRSKTILSIAAFIITFFVSVALASLFVVQTYQQPTYTVSNYNYGSSCSKNRRSAYLSETGVKITAFINEDKQNGIERDRRIYDAELDFRPAFESSEFPEYVEAVEEYVESSSNLNAADLPLDFQEKWNIHIKTWQDYSEFLNRMKSSSARKSLKVDELLSLDNDYSVNINQTWSEVLRNGRTHGANTY